MLNKAIESGKEHRKQYTGAARYIRSCRCNGGCGYCEDNRKYTTNRNIEKTDDIINEQLESIDIDTSSMIVRL